MDLMQHDGKIPESTFLRILPDQVEQMLRYFKMVLSVHLMGDGSVAKVTTDGTSGGLLVVDRVDRFTLSQKVVLKDSDTAAGTYYVTAIDVNAQKLTLSATRGGSVADISAYTVANGAKVYHPGALTNGMTSMRSQILSLANGGSTNLFGVAKTSAPFLQAIQRDGSDITSSNILAKIFDAYTQYKILGQGGSLPEVLVSFKHFGSILKLIEVQKGPFNVVPNSRKVNSYGWDTIEIGSVAGQTLKIVGLQEMADDCIFFVDWNAWTFYSNGLFKRRKSPEGKEFFEQRGTTGYSYILDHCVFGDLVCTAPWKNLVVYGISY